MTALVIRGATIHTCGPSGTLREGEVVVVDGRIVAVRAAGGEIPEGALVIEAAGLHLTPGLIDAHTHLGTAPVGFAHESKDLTEMTRPLTAELRASDGVWPGDVAFAHARSGGVTTVCVLPGSSNVIGGTALALKTVGHNVETMAVRDPVGLKAAFGYNVKHSHGVNAGRFPLTRMGIAALFRQAFEDALRYGEAREADPERPIDLRQEPLWAAATGKLKLRAHAYRADDLLTVLRLAREYGLRVVLEHAYEAHFVLDEVLLADAEVVYGPAMRTCGGSEHLHFSFEAVRVLREAGVRVALTTDHPALPIQYLGVQAGLCVRERMAPGDALLAITYWPARILGIDERVGSLTPGRDADMVLFDGPPLAIESRIVSTFIDGVLVYRDGDPPPVPGFAFARA